MKCEIVTGNMPQLWEDLLSQLHEKEYPSESIRHYREAMGRVDRYMRENQILEYTEAVGETYLATHGGRISSGRQFYMSFVILLCATNRICSSLVGFKFFPHRGHERGAQRKSFVGSIQMKRPIPSCSSPGTVRSSRWVAERTLCWVVPTVWTSIIG